LSLSLREPHFLHFLGFLPGEPLLRALHFMQIQRLAKSLSAASFCNGILFHQKNNIWKSNGLGLKIVGCGGCETFIYSFSVDYYMPSLYVNKR